MTDEILFEVRNRIGHITLNRPQVLNALSETMIAALHDQLSQWADDPNVNAVMIRGAGDKSFCAGGDIRAVYQSIKEGRTDQIPYFADEYKLDYDIHQYPKPYIALIDGIVMGGGMGIAQGAWLRIVTDRTKMAMPEVGIGFFPDVGGSYFLSRCPGSVGFYLGITGLPINAADALHASLADSYLPHEKIDLLDRLLDALVWTNDHRANLMQTITMVNASSSIDPTVATLRTAIDTHFSKESVPEIIASLQMETRPEYIDWAKEILMTLAKRSPTMMCVTQEQIRRGRAMDLADCFRMELAMVNECFIDGDFVEGVRALIIDKDTQPRWNPSRLDEVNINSIGRFFEACWSNEQHPLAALETTSIHRAMSLANYGSE
ncbi:MAG: enoyl-CoA hydratase/isomerase family protein [Pseudomonadota bacterium]